MTYRHELPQLSGRPFATDGGMETTLIFVEGLDLPCFASFVLLETDAGQAAMRRYFEPYVALASDRGPGSFSTRRLGVRTLIGEPGSAIREAHSTMPIARRSCWSKRSARKQDLARRS